MSGNHGSEENGRDPGSPDPLHERLAVQREQTRQQRDLSAHQRNISTPQSAIQTRMARLTGGPQPRQESVRKGLAFDDPHGVMPGVPEHKESRPPSTPEPSKSWEGLMEMNHHPAAGNALSILLKCVEK